MEIIKLTKRYTEKYRYPSTFKLYTTSKKTQYYFLGTFAKKSKKTYESNTRKKIENENDEKKSWWEYFFQIPIFGTFFSYRASMIK